MDEMKRRNRSGKMNRELQEKMKEGEEIDSRRRSRVSFFFLLFGWVFSLNLDCEFQAQQKRNDVASELIFIGRFYLGTWTPSPLRIHCFQYSIDVFAKQQLLIIRFFFSLNKIRLNLVNFLSHWTFSQILYFPSSFFFAVSSVFLGLQ